MVEVVEGRLLLLLYLRLLYLHLLLVKLQSVASMVLLVLFLELTQLLLKHRCIEMASDANVRRIWGILDKGLIFLLPPPPSSGSCPVSSSISSSSRPMSPSTLSSSLKTSCNIPSSSTGGEWGKGGGRRGKL